LTTATNLTNGVIEMPKQMNHAEYQKNLRKKTVDQLIFIRDDAQAAMRAWPDGENAGYYADEMHYAAMELARRAAK
jgi:hypothetical protein